MVIAAKYDHDEDKPRGDSGFSQGMAAVRQNDKWGYINREGKTVIPFRRAYSANRFNEGIAVFNDSKYIDQQGKTVRRIYERKPDEKVPWGGLYTLKNGLARISARGKWGYMDRIGKVVIKPRYQLAENFSEGLAVVSDTNLNQGDDK
jgi:hypothetical protein